MTQGENSTQSVMAEEEYSTQRNMVQGENSTQGSAWGGGLYGSILMYPTIRTQVSLVLFVKATIRHTQDEFLVATSYDCLPYKS